MNIWDYIKADPFFAEFLPEIKSHKFKIRGFNSRNNHTGFTDEEKAKINKALLKMIEKHKLGKKRGEKRKEKDLHAETLSTHIRRL